MHAGTGIGLAPDGVTPDALEVAVSTLTARTDTGGIFVTNREGDLTITSCGVIATVSGDIRIHNVMGSMTIDGPVSTASGKIHMKIKGALNVNDNITATGTVRIGVLETDDDYEAFAERVIISAGVTIRSTSADIKMHASDDVFMEANSLIKADIGSVIIKSGVGDGLGPFTMNATATVMAGKDVVIRAKGDLTLGVVTAGDTVKLTASKGAIIDADSDTLNITSMSLALRAHKGIGTGLNPIETSVSNLAARNGNEDNVSTGDIQLINSLPNQAALTITNVDGVDGIRNYAPMSATSGNINVTTSSKLIVAATVFTKGNITMTASEWLVAASGDDLIVMTGTKIRSVLGNILLRAGDNIIIQKGASVIASDGDVTLDSGYLDNDPLIGDSTTVSGKVSADGTVTIS